MLALNYLVFTKAGKLPLSQHLRHRLSIPL